MRAIRASRFKSPDTPDPEAIRNPQIRWINERKRRESLACTHEQYEGARALLAEWEAVRPLTMHALEQIKHLRKKVARLKCRLRYKGMTAKI
jgi:hypothetical protein